MATIDFDVSSYEAPKSNFDPLPRGEYLAIVTENQMKATKSGTGEYLELVIQIVDGEFSGRKIWERLNIHNANEVAEILWLGFVPCRYGLARQLIGLSHLLALPRLGSGWRYLGGRRARGRR